jgi:hypothetical protein
MRWDKNKRDITPFSPLKTTDVSAEYIASIFRIFNGLHGVISQMNSS